MKLHLSLCRLLGVIVPGALRADWRHKWESELRFREHQLGDGAGSIGAPGSNC